jgi:hypothetical protein
MNIYNCEQIVNNKNISKNLLTNACLYGIIITEGRERPPSIHTREVNKNGKEMVLVGVR